MRQDTVLWIGVFASPVVWFVNLETNFAFAPLACTGSGKIALYVSTGVALVLTAVVAFSSWTKWRKLRGLQAEEGQIVGVALAGAALSSLSFLVILAQAIPNLVLVGCE